MTLEDYAQNYSESTDLFIETLSLATSNNLVIPNNIEVAGETGRSARQRVHHISHGESQFDARLRRNKVF